MDTNKKVKFYLVFNIFNIFYNYIVCTYFFTQTLSVFFFTDVAPNSLDKIKLRCKTLRKRCFFFWETKRLKLPLKHEYKVDVLF